MLENLDYHGRLKNPLHSGKQGFILQAIFYHQLFEIYLTERSKSRTKTGQVFDMPVFSQLSSSYS